MAWIQTTSPEAAQGLLRRIYEAAVKRAGKVFNILRIQSPNPPVLEASMGLYIAAMHGSSPLSRARRELLATVVSRANKCHYWTVAHAEDLRAEVRDDKLVEAVKRDYRSADFSPADRALCDFAEKLTFSPAEVAPADLDALRTCGLDDRAIHDAVQVIAYFNYINRIADGLGVDLEPGMPPNPNQEPGWFVSLDGPP